MAFKDEATEKAYFREYYKKNKAKRNKQTKAYYESNQDKFRELERLKSLSQEIEWLFIGNKPQSFLHKLMRI